MYLSTIEWLMCVSELNFFFFPVLWCGTKKKTGGSLEDGRMEGGVSLSHGQLGSSSAGGNLYGGGGVGAPRSTTSSSSSQSPPATGPIAISSGSAASGKMAAPTSNGGGGRKYQCKMCPQVGPIPIILILFIPFSLFFFHFVLISSGWPCFGYHLLGSNTRCMSRQIERNSEKRKTPLFLLPSTHEQLRPLSGEIKQQRDWSIRLINKKFFCSPSGRRKDNSSACACHTRAPCPSRAAGSKHFSIF